MLIFDFGGPGVLGMVGLASEVWTLFDSSWSASLPIGRWWVAVVSRGFQLFACLLFRGALFRVEVEVQFRLPQHKTGQSTPK